MSTLISLIIPLVILLPNIVFTMTKPTHKPPPAVESRGLLVLAVLEKAGQIGAFLIPAFLTLVIDSPVKIIAALGMFIALAVYYEGWVRYFFNNRDYRILYQPLLGLPVPMAISPVVYFLCAAVALESYLLLLASVIFGAGHITISFHEYRRVIKDRY